MFSSKPSAAEAAEAAQSRRISMHGRTAVITGGSRGIGAAVACCMAQQGCNVVIGSNSSSSELESVVGCIKSNGGNAISVSCDVCKEKDIKKLFQKAEDTYGGVDFVFINAGVCEVPRLHESTEDDMHKLFETNICGGVCSFKAAINALRKRGGGAIVINSSITSLENRAELSRDECFVLDAMSKAALDVLVRHGGYYKAEGIRVYGVNPNVIDTKLARETAQDLETNMRGLSDKNTIFKGEPGTPEQLAKVVLSLFDNSTCYETSENIVVDHDRTYSAQVHYNKMECKAPVEIDEKKVMDFRGAPLEAAR